LGKKKEKVSPKIAFDYNKDNEANADSITNLVDTVDKQLDELANQVRQIPNITHNLKEIKESIKKDIKEQSFSNLGIKSITPKLRKMLGQGYQDQAKSEGNLGKEVAPMKYEKDIRQFKNKFFMKWVKNFIASLNKFKINNSWYNPKKAIAEIARLDIKKTPVFFKPKKI